MSQAIGGIVRNGVIVPDAPLPEGIRVEIRISTRRVDVPSEMQEEFDAWNRASDRALEEFERLLGREEQDEKR